MGKIICDICGTSYPDTAQQCPICGCTREAAAQMLGEDLLLDEIVSVDDESAGKFSSRKKKEIFDYDEVNSAPGEPDEEESTFAEEEEYEEDTQEDRPNTVAVILLTVLIAALLLTAGILFFRYILPNMNGDKNGTEPAAQQTVPQTLQSFAAESAIPCETLVLSSGNKAVLKEEGGRFLLHVSAHPSDTTDEILFASADESIATVTADGRIEAVSEGETIVTITCGSKKIECQVVVQYSDEEPTVEPSILPENTAPGATAPAEENSSAEEPTAAPSDTTVKKDVKLRLKRKDITLGVGYEYQLVLDCALEQNEVEWSSEHTHIATVDENGVVKAIKGGTTMITAKYGDQEVECMVRCSW